MIDPHSDYEMKDVTNHKGIHQGMLLSLVAISYKR